MQNKISSCADRLSMVLALTVSALLFFGALSMADDLQGGGTVPRQQAGENSKESDEAGTIRDAGEIRFKQHRVGQSPSLHGAAIKGNSGGTITVEQGAAEGESGGRVLKYGDQPK